MNEKYLWELWAKCKHPHPKYGGGDMVWPMEFAELIVQECISKLDDIGVIDRDSRTIAMKVISEHFGVKE